MKAEAPLGAGQGLEAAVDPVREPLLEGGEPGVAGQHGVGGRQSFKQVVDRVRAACLGGRQPDPVGTQAVAGELVDEDRIEVVDGGVRVAVEGAGPDGWERRGDRGERGLDALVEGRAPERVPPAVAVVEERMDETLGDRAPRQLHHGEDRLGARSQLEPVGRRLRKRDQLRRLEPAGGSPRPASGRSAIAGIPARRSPADSAPSPSRARTSAVASSCQRTSRVGAAALGRSSVVG